MKTTYYSLFGLFAFVVSLTPSTTVYADTVKQACIKEAEADFRQAESDARFERRSAKASCRFSPEVATCVTECFPALKSCLQPIFEGLKSCRKSCFETLIAARNAARTEFGCGSSCNTNGDFQRAVVEANLAFNSCRITCRSTDETTNARAGCRTAHGLCVNACKDEG